MAKVTSYGRGIRFRKRVSVFAASWLVPLTLGFFSATSQAAGSVTPGGVVMDVPGQTLPVPDGTYTGAGATYIFNVSAGTIENTGSVTLQRGTSNVAEFVRANGSGATALLNNLTIDPFASSGSGTYGLYAGNNGNIVVNGLYKITGSGTVWGAAAGSSGTAGTITLNDVDISITGGTGGAGLITSTLASNVLTTNGTVLINNAASSSNGVFVAQNSTINLLGDSNDITLSGTGSTGISLAANSTLNATNLVTVTGTAASNSALIVSGTNGKAMLNGGLTANVTGTAVNVSGGGTANISGGGNITTNGNAAYGLYSTGAASSITANNLVINTKGTNSTAIYALSGATVSLLGSSISMNQTGMTVVANSNNSVINLTDSSVVNKGATSSEGLTAVNNAQLNANNVKVSILASGVSAPANNSSATTAVEVYGGGRINLLNSTLYTTASYAYGIRAFSSTSGTVYMRGGSIYTGISLNTNGDPVDRFGNPTSDPSQFVARGSTGSHGVFAQTGKVYLNVDPATGLATGTSSSVNTFGTSANGFYATGANSIITADSTAITTLSNNANGVAVDSSGSIGLSNSTITTSGNTAYGAYANGAGSTITLGNIAITTGGLNAHGLYAGVGALIQMNSGSTAITANGNASTSDPTTAGIIATSGGSITSVTGTTLEVTMNGSANGANRPYGILNAGGTIQLDGAAKVTTNGFNSFAVRSQGGALSINGNLDITTAQGVGIHATNTGASVTLAGALNTINVGAQNGSISDGLLVSGGGTITVNSAQTNITTTGTNAYGIQLQTNTASLNLNGAMNIVTNGQASHGFYLSGGAQRTIDGTASSTGRLPDIVVHGANSAVLAASGTGSLFTLAGTAALSMGMTDGVGTWGAKADTSGIITLTGNSSSGGTGLWASNGTLNLLGNANAAGSRVLLDTNAVLNLQNGTTNTVAIGSLEGAAGTKVNLYGNTLSMGSNNGGNNGSSVDEANYAGSFIGSGSLVKTGSLTQILSGAGNTIGSVLVNGGTLRFEETGAFATTGNYTTASGGTTAIGQVSSTLVIGGIFTQENDSVLNVTLGASPDITATSAQLDGTLVVNGFSDIGGTPTTASDAMSLQYILLHTTDGITGDFDNNPLISTGLDYLLHDGHLTNGNLDYELGFRLAWTEGGQSGGTGNFTINEGTGFDVNVVLSDQTIPSGGFASGWDGSSLVKKGLGRLVLSKVNTYTGTTTVNEGILQTTINNAFAESSDVIVNTDGILDLDGTSQTAKRLSNGVSGGGSITLNGGVLTVDNSSGDSTFSGVISNGGLVGGSFVHGGTSGTLILTGDNTYTGATTNNAGTTLQIGNGTMTGSLASSSISNEGTVIFNGNDDSAYDGTLSGTGELIKDGEGILTLSGAASSQSSVEVKGGTLSFNQIGSFTTTGNYTTASDATTAIGQSSSTLVIGGVFTQESDSVLNVTLGSSPDITAESAQLDGTLVVNGFADIGGTPVKASDATSLQYILLHTTDGITGDFDNNPLISTNLDYLLHDGHVTNGGLDYELGFRLAWTEGGQSAGTGDFTINEGTGFDVDVVLSDQTVPSGGFASGWDGSSLEKKGLGRLVLSEANTYTGTTTVSGGTLALSGIGDISTSSSVTLNNSGTATPTILDLSDLTTHATTLNNLNGDEGTILNMGSGTALTVHTTQASAFAGDFLADSTPEASQLIKTGAEELILSGKTEWQGNTLINEGTLTLDGTNGGAQLVSNVVGQTGTTLKLIHGATLTGWIDPLDMQMGSSSTWTMTGDSVLASQTFLDNTAHVIFAGGDGVQTFSRLMIGDLEGTGGFYTMRTNIVGNGAGSIGDLLEVTGFSEGNHNLEVQNSGSTAVRGTETLTIVDTEDGAATFGLTHKVEVGGYLYDLRRTVADDTNWELYSTGKYTPAAGASIDAFAGGYLLNYAETQTLLQRMGDLRQTESQHGAWARIFGGKFDANGSSFLSGFDMTYSGIQAGYDQKISLKNGKGDFYVGGMFGYGKGNLDYTTGSGSIDSKTLGVYGTYIAPSGLYTDLVLKYGWMNHDFKVLDTAGDRVTGSDINTSGVSVSLEVGKKIHFNKEQKQGWYLEPQAQLSVGHQSGDSFTASNGLRVEVDSYTSILGRLGMNIGYELKSGKNPVNVYGKVSYMHDFNGDIGFKMNGIKNQQSFGDSWWAYGVGITAQINEKHNIYLDIERSNGGEFRQPWSVNGGYRFNW